MEVNEIKDLIETGATAIGGVIIGIYAVITIIKYIFQSLGGVTKISEIKNTVSNE